MIQTMLQNLIDQALTYNYTITEFKLGSTPMMLLIAETNRQFPIHHNRIVMVQTFMGVPIKDHPHNYEIVFSIKPKIFGDDRTTGK